MYEVFDRNPVISLIYQRISTCINIYERDSSFNHPYTYLHSLTFSQIFRSTVDHSDVPARCSHTIPRYSQHTIPMDSIHPNNNHQPPAGSDFQQHGSLFTLFLHSPLTALCYVCNVGDVPMHHWDRCQGYVDKFVTEASRLVTRCRIDEIEKGIGCIGTQSI